RTKNDASATETAPSVCPIAPRRKYSDRREQGRCPKRREEIGDHPGSTAIRRDARRRALTLHWNLLVVGRLCQTPLCPIRVAMKSRRLTQTRYNGGIVQRCGNHKAFSIRINRKRTLLLG